MLCSLLSSSKIPPYLPSFLGLGGCSVVVGHPYRLTYGRGQVRCCPSILPTIPKCVDLEVEVEEEIRV